MSIDELMIHSFYRMMVRTVLLPLRNQAFESTRKARISDTEKEALSSGSVGFEREILGGKPDWRKLMELPPPALTEREKAFLDGPVESLCAMLDDWEIRNELKDLPEEIWDYLKRHGFFGMIIPETYGGLGFSARAHSDVVMKLASRSTTACVTAMVPNSLGPAELLLHYGTQAQKDHYLPRLAQGLEIPSFALTEPEAGSDAGSMTSKGVVCERDGRLGILLNWEKRYITLSPITTLLGLAFKLYDPDCLLGDNADIGITLALIPADTPGVVVGRRHNPLGVPFQNGPTTGTDVWIPLDQVIGGREYVGQGWRMLMECLSVGRCISLPALSVGSAKLVSRLCGAYSRIRKQFKVPIHQFEGVEELLARIAGTTYMMEAARVATLQMLDRGEHPTILSAVLKYHMTEAGRRLITDGMDILGGKGVCEGPGNLLAALHHGIPIGITVEGANLLTRNMIIFGQGSVRSHPFLLKEIEAARLPDRTEARQAFTDLMARHVRLSVENTFRSLIYGLLDGGPSGAFTGSGACTAMEKRYYSGINRLCAAYATLADMALMLLGDSLKRKERLSALLGDALSALYLASCTLRHFAIQGRPEEDAPLVDWACRTLLHQTEESLDRLLQNFPNPWLAGMLRPVIFPRGRRFHPPSHRIDRKAANTILQPGSARDRLTAGIFLPTAEDEPLGLLDACFRAVIEAEPLERKVAQAVKEGRITGDNPKERLRSAVEHHILSRAESDLLLRAELLRREVIRVDDFDAALGEGGAGLAITDARRMKAIYPVGTNWNIEIPRIDLVELMENAVHRFGDAPCIDFLGKKYSYREFGEQVSRATAGLQKLGVRKGDRVGLYMINTAYYPILFFAALKAGAVVVNFCPMHTLAELREQAIDSGVRILVTLDLKEYFNKALQLRQEGVLDRVIACRMEEALPFLKAQAYRILRASQTVRPEELEEKGAGATTGITWYRDLISREQAGALPGSAAHPAPVPLHPDDMALLQYTGGTSGTPKGAILTHYNLVANVIQIEEFFKATANKPEAAALLRPGKERVLASIPYFHIFGLTVAMLSGLKLGGELLILPDPRNIRETLKTIHEKKPTLFPAVPRLLQAVCENPRTNAFDLSALKTVISGGAALPVSVKTGFETVAAKIGLVKQGYGLTETSPVVTSNPAYGLNKPESVGLPLPRTRIKIVAPGHSDPNPDRILQIGEIGEIYVSGPQIMQGYLGRDGETADTLLDGWLRTGDLGYLDEDYYLHIVDRQKRLIIVNGLNVYPTQLENALNKHPAIAECMVISVPDARSGEAAKAFIRLRNGLAQPPGIAEIREFLSETLSRVELPKHIEIITEDLPKTAVGKPDWRTMQERERLRPTVIGDEDPMEQAS